MFHLDQFLVPTDDISVPIETSNSKPSKWVRALAEKNPWLVAIPETWINDNFNVWGLKDQFPNFRYAFAVIKGQSFNLPEDLREIDIEIEARQVYAQIHQRYLLTYAGVKEMQPKYANALFGRCPRVNCNHCRLLPIGPMPTFGQSTVKCYCTSCKDIYNTDSCELDGAYFGPYFCQFFHQALMCEIGFPKGEPQIISYAGIPFEKDEKVCRSKIIHPME